MTGVKEKIKSSTKAVGCKYFAGGILHLGNERGDGEGGKNKKTLPPGHTI